MSEHLLEFRRNILDSVSPSFCAAKWYNASIHLGHGYTHSCHLPLPHEINKEELESNPSAIHNTEHKKKQRKMMLEGDRPSECEYCWKIEDIKRDNISDRVFKSRIYKIEDIARLPKQSWDADVNLKTLELSFDRICNFACSYCNAGYSTTWANDLKSFGPYQYFKTEGGGQYQHDGKSFEPYGKFNVGNPYIEAFFRWWPNLSKDLQELRFTGGEPVMSNNFWRLMEIVKTQELEHMALAVNSNMGMKKSLLDKLIELTNSLNVKMFDLYTSNESLGAHAEYIRDGMVYDQWKKNLIHFIENAKFRSVTIMMTINSLCLFSVTEFMDDMLTLKKKYGHNRPHIDLNILRWPSFMSPINLPDHLKKYCHEKLSTWYLKNKSNPLLVDFERAQIERLLDYIDTVNQAHKRASTDDEKLWHDFKSFYHQYDLRRGKDFTQTWPKVLVDWYNTIEIDTTIKRIQFVKLEKDFFNTEK